MSNITPDAAFILTILAMPVIVTVAYGVTCLVERIRRRR